MGGIRLNHPNKQTHTHTSRPESCQNTRARHKMMAADSIERPLQSLSVARLATASLSFLQHMKSFFDWMKAERLKVCTGH